MHPDIQDCSRAVEQTLEKYQYIFTHDLHLSHSCCSEGHLAEPSSLKCLLQVLTLVSLLTYTLNKNKFHKMFRLQKL